MLNPATLRPGDIISHPSWSPTCYTVSSVEEGRFYIDMGGSQPNGFPFYSEFYLVSPVRVERKKSGFARFIQKVEHG